MTKGFWYALGMEVKERRHAFHYVSLIFSRFYHFTTLNSSIALSYKVIFTYIKHKKKKNL